MDQSTLITFLILIFCTIFILSQIILVPSFGTKSKESRQIRERLREFSNATHQDELSLVRRKNLEKMSTLERWLAKSPFAEQLDDLLEQAGKKYPGYRLLLMMIALAITLGIVVWFLTFNILGAVIAFIFGGWIPLLIIKNDRKKRFELFEEQLPEALDMMCRALRAGYPFNDALRYISEEMPDPIGHEFGITFEEINYGRELRQAFNFLIMRVPSANLVSATTAIIIQRETGGNLAELLEKISKLLRQRFRFQRRVKTLTTEGRLSAWMLALLPFFVFLVINFLNPTFMDPLYDTPVGNYILIGGLVLQVIGAFWVRSMLDFEI